ncbi:MAG: T9SS type A sorting domain-containing protein [Bacteroidota bacterium]
MKNKTERILLVPLLLFISLSCRSQETVTTAGGDASGSGGSASYSVGQVVYSTNNGVTEYEIQGVQQPYEISVISGTGPETGINLQCIAFPNPASDYLLIEISGDQVQNLTYSLYDLTGKSISAGSVTGTQTKVSLAGLARATYILSVKQDNTEVKSFQIIKR